MVVKKWTLLLGFTKLTSKKNCTFVLSKNNIMLLSTLLISLGGHEIIIILIIILLLFGGKKIPQLMKGLGQGIKEFKSASKEPGTGSKDVDNNDNKKDK